MDNQPIPFNQSYITGKEQHYMLDTLRGNKLSGDGPYMKRCHQWLEQKTSCNKALLTPSCTAALEMTALLLNIQPGDEIIMPSYTFVSTANAFVLRGAVPVFIDIREDTLNMDEHLIEMAISPRTKAIVPVHYAGVACAMDVIIRIAKEHTLAVVEDAAQGIMAAYKNKPLGSIGHLSAFSFHETKNVMCGEGGALLINDTALISRAELVWEKGTDRRRFWKGEIDKYTWQDIGSSFLPSELTSAFLWAQLENAHHITAQRTASWNYYHTILAPLEVSGAIRRPIIPTDCQHNAHMYYIILHPDIERHVVLNALKRRGVHAVSHYTPLHSSPAGQRYGRVHGDLHITHKLSEQLIRLPLWIGLTEKQQNKIAAVLKEATAVY